MIDARPRQRLRGLPTVADAIARVLVLLLLAAPTGSRAEPSKRPYPITEEREPCRDYEPLRRPLFGDTHVHTAYSHDASTQDTRNTPREAYRFARGERVGIQPYDAEGRATRHVRLDRPLDWTAISDHSEMFGEVRICSDPKHPEYDSDVCWNKRNAPFALMGFLARISATNERHKMCGPAAQLCRDAARDVWGDIQAAAEAAYDRSAACRFTSVIGYEWTSSIASNLHRNVLFRNHVVPDEAISSVDTISAFRLFERLEQACTKGRPGCDVVVIPHNSNISMDGVMFQTTRLTSVAGANGEVDREEAQLRNRFERLIEIMQHKGDSECLLGAETTDEACSFEKLPYDAMSGALRAPTNPPKRSAMVREGLKKGLLLEQRLGINPLKFGILASTDTHMATPGLVAEQSWIGHGGASRVLSPAVPQGLPDNIEFNPGGLAVVWAEENARDSIFEALSRREVYGTSGTRPEVRFFGGWRYPDDLCRARDLVARGYAEGVPMGQDLPRRLQPEQTGGAAAPVFVVSAMQDPGTKSRPGTPLQRIQIVKGWTEKGATHERVFDVAGGPNDASVDPTTCEPKGEGARSLCAVWRDPGFDPEENAFYYARVLENPTCRWHRHLCVAAKVDCAKPESIGKGFEACCEASQPSTVQERAWTSPIWYEADGGAHAN
ncbi:MAG: DUF3604 domain-containing protein [Deltaproteobacteria bacterium]|nr:DUF3604 domain-containing protein [Deltaproteobacteria bacterium]